MSQLQTLKVKNGYPSTSPTIWRYVSITPSTRFPITEAIPGLLEIEWPVLNLREFKKCGEGTPIVHFSSGAGSLERGFGSGSDILTDGVSVYRRITQKEVGKAGPSGLKVVRNKHLVWFIRKITSVSLADIQPMLDEVEDKGA